MKKRIILIAFTGLYILGLYLPAAAQTWGTPVRIPHILGVGGNIGSYVKMITVNGNPAMAFYDDLRTNLVYMRANDSIGLTWGEPVYLDITADNGTYLSLCMVNGKPAVSYYSPTTTNLKYIRALDASGTTWGTPVTVAVAGGTHTCLKIINGYPAISYFNGDLNYVQATDADGTSWGTPVLVDAVGNTGEYSSLETVNGKPAIAYMDVTNGFLKYVQASDINGVSWNIPGYVDTSIPATGVYASLCVVDGNPAISYNAMGTLKYVRAVDTDGTMWASPQAIAPDGTSGSLSVVNGHPFITYYNYDEAAQMGVRANDAQGNSWPLSTTIDTGPVDYYSVCAIIHGKPAVAYAGNPNSLKYSRSGNVNGTSWGAPQQFTFTGYGGKHLSIHYFNGIPSVMYDIDSKLMYVRAYDSSGTTWKTPQHVNTGFFNEVSSLMEVQGLPAAATLQTSGGYAVLYLRANNVEGTSWTAPVVVDPVSGTAMQLYLVNGHPAMVYVAGGEIKYVRANDSLGVSWGIPVVLSGTMAYYPSLCVVNGYPAVCYNEGGNLRYTRALDSAGTAWGSSILVDAAGDTGYYGTLIIVNGRPAITYVNWATQMRYIRATDVNGAGWGTPVTLESGFVSQPYMHLVNGNPAVTYFNETTDVLKIKTALDADGTSWAAAQVLTPVPVIPGMYDDAIVMGSNNNGYAGIAYYDDGTRYPYFISTCMPASLPVPVTNSVTICPGQQVTFAAAGNGALHWYNAPAGGTPLAVAPEFTIPPVYTSDTFYVESVTCAGSSARVPLNVYAYPVIPVTGPFADTLCIDAAPALLSGAQPAGGTYSGTGIASGVFNPVAAGAGAHAVVYTYIDTNNCTVSGTDTMLVNALPAVVFNFPGSDTLCINAAPVVLAGGIPAGGAYSGTGVSGTVFNAVAAGAGMHMITYAYTDANGCANTATAAVMVDNCLGMMQPVQPENFLRVYPNPAGLYVTVEVDSPGMLYIMDIAGKVVLQQMLNGQKTSIGFGELENGIYTLVYKGNRTTTTHLVIQH